MTNPGIDAFLGFAAARQVSDNDVIATPIGYEVYSFGQLAEIRSVCREHGLWVFPASPEGRAEAEAFTNDHYCCNYTPNQARAAAGLPRYRRPPNKSRRKAHA